MLRHYRNIRLLLAYAAATALVCGCAGMRDNAGSEVAPLTGPSTVTPTAAYTKAVASSGGFVVPESEMEAKLANLAHDVAIALANPTTRSRIFRALSESKIREHKLHFRTVLNATDVDLLTEMAKQHGGNRDRVLARMDSLIDLEFYMPIPAHRERWKGGTDLLVVSYPNDDGAQPRGFDLKGNEVPVSALTPPETPTLVLVPVETDFATDTVDQVGAATFAGSDALRLDVLDPVTGPQWYMTSVHLDDTHEGWGLGAPELEVHDFLEQSTGIFADKWCASEGMPAPYNWNMDGGDWTGSVTLATENFIGNTKVQYQMWEDDSAPCSTSNGTMTSGTPPKTTSAISSAMQNLATLLINVYETKKSDGTTIKKIQAYAGNIKPAYNIVDAVNQDDFVGELEGPTGQCWRASGGSPFNIYSSAGTHYEGLAWINTDYGVKDPICGIPPMSVTIDGPSSATSCSVTTYHANIYSGASPFAITWTWAGGSSTGSDPYLMVNLPSGTNLVAVQVTDDKGSHAATSVMTEVTGC